MKAEGTQQVAQGAIEDGGQWPCPRCDTMMIEKVQQVRGGPLRWWCRFCMRSWGEGETEPYD